MRWMKISEWENMGGRHCDMPVTMLYVQDTVTPVKGLSLAGYWCVYDQRWCDTDGEALLPIGWEVTHILEVTDPEGV